MRERLILLVEDNPDHEELTLRALRQSKVANRIVVVRDGAQALDYLFGAGDFSGRDTGEQPEVILLDLKLPKVDGLEVLERLRRDPKTRLIPVVVLTSSSEETDVKRSYQLGANSYVRKPVGFGEFTERLRQLQAYWTQINEPHAKSRAS